MNTHKLKCEHPTQIQLIFDNNSKTTNNQPQTEKNQQKKDKKRKDWPALGEVKGGEAAEGRLEDEAAEGRPTLACRGRRLCAKKACSACVPRKLAPRRNPPRHFQSLTQVQMVHALPDRSPGCSTRWHHPHDSSGARGRCNQGEGLSWPLRRGRVLLPRWLVLYDPWVARFGLVSETKSIFSILTNLRQIFDKEFPAFD